IPDHGQDATPANDRRYSNDQLAGVFAKTEAIAKVMDEYGYDTLWLAEHHFQYEGYECLPNILMLAVHLAHITRQLRIGCGFNIAPMWHPLRLAEDYATADILTKGRTVFGVGRGYHSREVETFGAPIIDQEANRALFEEQVEIVFKAFNNESFSHKGKHYAIPADVPYRGYQLKELTLVPRPVNLPVECWQPIVSASTRGIEFMLRHGIRGLVGGDDGRGADPGLPARGKFDGPQLPTRRRPGDRRVVLSSQDARAGDPRDAAVLRRACENVCPARVRARHHTGTGRSGRRARRLGRCWCAD